jgi:predicted dehydrogenase
MALGETTGRGGCDTLAGENMRIGLAGYGHWGRKHARVLTALEGVDLAIFEQSAEARCEAAATHPRATVASDLVEHLHELDAVVIATPPETHRQLGLEALRAGCHLLVEKPMAMTVLDCQELVDAAFWADRLLMVGHTYDYHGVVEELYRNTTRELVGDLLHLRSVRTNIGMHRSDVSVLWDLAPHDVAIINRIVGRPPAAVSAWMGDHTGRGVADHAIVHLTYEPPGISATIEVSWLSPRKVRELTVVGTTSTVVFDEVDTALPLRIHRVDTHHRPQAVMSLVLDHEAPAGGRTPGAPMREPLEVEIHHFVDCIRTGRRPLSHGLAGLDVVRVLEAAEHSAQRGGPVALAASEIAVVNG